MRIAIVGAGVSGLVAAYRLSERHDVTVFERDDRAGGHAHTFDAEWEGERRAIDVGFIVFNDRTYPKFTRLLDELGVASRPTSMSFSVTDERDGIEYKGDSLDTVFAQRRNALRPSFYRMLFDVLRFNREARRLQETDDSELTVAEFLRRGGYSTSFVRRYLLPMGAAIWSCPLGTFAEFPIRFVADFYANHGLIDLVDRPIWRTIDGGSRTYVEKLTRPFRDRIRLGVSVACVRRHASFVEVIASDGLAGRFDHVVFACHADQALAMLASDATAVERETLSAFPYRPNVGTLHTDVALLPRSRRAWASWNYRVRTDDDEAYVTYRMNALHGFQSRHEFLVTLNETSRIDPAKILARFDYAHPTFTARRAAAQCGLRELNGANRTSYCGAYCGNGFHEDGVASALAAVESIERLGRRGGETSSAGVAVA